MSFIIPPKVIAATDALIKRYTVVDEEFDTPEYTSYLGTPVWSQLEFLSDGVEDFVGSPTTQNPNNGVQNLILQTVLLTVTQSKNIIKTPIQGRNGTVKEYISDGDYQINIRGSIVSPFPMVYPREEVDLLLRYCRANLQIAVASDFLEQFEIRSIVIENYTVSEKLGSRNEVPFELQCISDIPIEFQVNA